MSNQVLTREEFLGPHPGEFAKRQWLAYKRLTPEQRAKIEALKAYEGKQVYFTYRGKREVYTVIAVMLRPGDKVWHGATYCSSYPYDFRLAKGVVELASGCGGFWTRNIEAVEMMQ